MEQLAVIGYRNLIRTGWNTGTFSSQMVEPEKLRCLLEAAGRTPSHLDEQPWSFIITTRDDAVEYERLLSCLSDVNFEWAQGAPVLMLVVVRLNHASSGDPNKYAFRDVRHAISNISIRAKGMGLAAHQIAGFDSARAQSQFQIPSGHASTSVIALGYPDVPARSAGDLQEPETIAHRPLESFVFTRSWGQPSPVLDRSSQKPSRFELGC